MWTERFAPSPTGPLHLGHAFSALTAFERAQAAGGQFLLRIEDIDQTRSRPEWESGIYKDLAWLGLRWPVPVLRQSDRMAAYRAALDQLWAQDLLFACTCSRSDIVAALSAPQEGAPPPLGPDGPVYPGTCRKRRASVIGAMPDNTALRLDMRAGLARITPARLSFTETGAGPGGERGRQQPRKAALMKGIGDVALARAAFGTSYHLSVVLDDAHQRITHVTRGQDLFDATAIHVVLQALLDLPTPIYHHHRLIRDAAGKRLAKRDDARAIAKYRAEGATPADVRAMVGM